MSWSKAIKELGPAGVLFLSADGASVNCIIVADPVVMEGKYKNKPQTRIGAPIVTAEGFCLLIVGKRTSRKLATLEPKFKDHIINITRHGVEGDSDATYECTALPDAAMFKTLAGIKAKEFSKEALRDATIDAKEVLLRS